MAEGGGGGLVRCLGHVTLWNVTLRYVFSRSMGGGSFAQSQTFARGAPKFLFDISINFAQISRKIRAVTTCARPKRKQKDSRKRNDVCMHTEQTSPWLRLNAKDTLTRPRG